jgi:hypothetical protein
MKARNLIILIALALLLPAPATGNAADSSGFRACRFDGFKKFPSITRLRARDTSCRTARRLARKVQDNGSSLQPLIYLRGERWKAKYTARTEGDAVWYRTVLRSRDRVVTMNLGS